MLKIIALCSSVLCIGTAGGLYTASSLESTAPSTVTQGQTLTADPSTMVDTAKAISHIDSGKAALCKTTITGVDYFSNYTNYVGGYWYIGLSNLTLAQAISPTKTLYDTAGNALMKTTISGKRYCLHPERWSNGYWALAFSSLAQERNYLTSNPSTSGPSIK